MITHCGDFDATCRSSHRFLGTPKQKRAPASAAARTDRPENTETRQAPEAREGTHNAADVRVFPDK